MKRAFFLLVYYLLLQWLPASRRLYGIPGRLRRWCCRRVFAQCGKNVNIERRVYFGSGVRVRLGDDSGIGVGAKLSPGGINIGANVLMGEEVLFLTQNHAYADPTVPIRRQGDFEPEPITIGDDVWIGSRVIILPGVEIGTGAVVGAGAVVTRAVEPYAVVAGNPARVIGHRRG